MLETLYVYRMNIIKWGFSPNFGPNNCQSRYMFYMPYLESIVIVICSVYKQEECQCHCCQLQFADSVLL